MADLKLHGAGAVVNLWYGTTVQYNTVQYRTNVQ